MERPIAFLLLVSYSIAVHASFMTQPEQIHLSYGRSPDEMVVMWSTMNYTHSTAVLYGLAPGKTTQLVRGDSKKFVDWGPLRHTQWIHNVRLTGLKPGTVYYYRCGGEGGWSQEFHFRSMQDGTNWSPRFVMYGDLGVVNGRSIPELQDDVQDHLYDAILHVGDFAYNLDDDNAMVGDRFMNMVQPVAAYSPYLTAVGNHEQKYNFSNYKNRFMMPGDESSDNMFYSVNIGPVHLVSYSTEYYFFIEYGIKQAYNQYAWLEKDLAEANKPENRAKQPWIVTMGHRPMYCSNNDTDDCTKHESIVRTGFSHVIGLEKLFYKYGVDVILEAHEHSYERLWPLYDRQVMNGSYDHPYTNPRAPVHIITGSAGCDEDITPFDKYREYWSAYRNEDYGYSRMTAFNDTHLYIEQVSVDQPGGEVVDRVWIIKDKHGHYE